MTVMATARSFQMHDTRMPSDAPQLSMSTSVRVNHQNLAPVAW